MTVETERAPLPEGETATVTLTVGGMTCAACVSHLEHALGDVQGVRSATVNLATERATVRYEPGAADVGELRSAIEGAGYSATDAGPDAEAYAPPRQAGELRRRAAGCLVAAAGIMAMNMIPAFERLFPFHLDFLLLALAAPAQFWGGQSFYLGAWAALRRRSSDMNTLIAVGSTAAFAYSAAITLLRGVMELSPSDAPTFFETGAAILGLTLLGRYLEARAKNRATTAVASLMRIQPDTARVILDGVEREVDVGEVAVGQLLVTLPGERIAVDGVVVEGESWVNESALTGESMPASKSPGDGVYGATVNTTGSLTVRAVAVGKNSMMSRIIRMVEEAQGSKAPIQRVADIVASYFVPTVISVAAAVFVFWLLLGPSPSYVYAMIASVAVLVVACPCAMGLATPTAIIVGVGRAAELGALFRSAEALERAHKIDVVAFDKTGTLTTGAPVVTSIESRGCTDDEALALAARLERASEHPVGRAIVAEAARRGLPIEGGRAHTQALPGMGIVARIDGSEVAVGNEAMSHRRSFAMNGLLDAGRRMADAGKTVSYLAVDGEARAAIGVSDSLREGVEEALASLRRQGIRLALITGDSERAAAAAARSLGFDDVVSNVMPGEKAERIRALQAEGACVAMVGDGINDAPALAQADVGIALSTGTDIAMETADVTLYRGDVRGVARAIALSRKTMRTIRQNLFWAMAYNVALIPIAAGVLYPFFSSGGTPDALAPILGEHGFLNPMLAAAAMAASSVSVISNSLRLKRATIKD